MKPRKEGDTMSGRMSLALPEEYAAEVEATLDEWQQGDKIRRLWARDASLWTKRCQRLVEKSVRRTAQNH